MPWLFWVRRPSLYLLHRNITSKAKKPFDDKVLERWKPLTGEPAVIFRWLITTWCNYRCQYCEMEHGRKDKNGQAGPHAFDIFPVEQWIEAFKHHSKGKKVAVTITGGEPMIDRKAMPDFLRQLVAIPEIKTVRIDSNASIDPEPYKDIDLSKIILMCTYHPSQISEVDFIKNIDMLIDSGFKVGLINYVMTHENILEYKRLSDVFLERNIPLHPNPLWDPEEPYSKEELKIIRDSLPKLDFYYRTKTASPFNFKCLYPSIAYTINQKGDLYPACCPDKLHGSFFDPELPPLPDEPIRCAYKSCVCLDKYSFLEGVDRNISLQPLDVYSKLLLEIKRKMK